MFAVLLASLTLAPVLPVSVGNIQLHALWDQSSLVVLARVEKVEKIPHELPEWVSGESGAPRTAAPETSIAQLRILQTFRGPQDVRSILVPLDRSFICDITDALPGETALFFLESSRVIAGEGTEFRARLDTVFGEHEFLKIGFWGRGRMAVYGQGESRCVESWTDVLFPEGIREAPWDSRFAHGSTRSTPYDEFCRILETYRRLEDDHFLSASSTPGTSGDWGWSLAVANEGSARFLLIEPDKTVDKILRRGREREYILDLDSVLLRALRDAIESERAWSLPTVLGTMRASAHQRQMSFVRKSGQSGSETSVLLFAIDDGWMSEPSRREPTLRALRVWSRIRGLIQDRACADSRQDDQVWLAMAR